MQKIYDKVLRGQALTPEDALCMLEARQGSPDYDQIVHLADAYARKTFSGKGQVFSQIGLDAQPCPVNCGFCALADDYFPSEQQRIKSDDEILALTCQLVDAKTHELFLMATAAYDPTEFLRIGRRVRAAIPRHMRLVANVGDFDTDYARQLKAAGFTGVYHVCRLGEGTDTLATAQQRVNTLDAVCGAGLELYYCVEPIGPEHSNAQLVTEIFRTAEYAVGVMAVMRRAPVPGTPLHSRGETPAHRLALICAVTLLCARPRRAMGVHEPDALSLMAGANQIYAETGVNPRDRNLCTEKGRGFSVADARRLLWDTGWE